MGRLCGLAGGYGPGPWGWSLAGRRRARPWGVQGRNGSRPAPAGAVPPPLRACLQVTGQQAEGLDVVPGGGGGDGPHIGGQVGGPFGAGAVEVLAADHRGAQGALGFVVVLIQNSE